MKILLLGKTGLIGQALFAVLQQKHEIAAPSHVECDIQNKAQLEVVISTFSPDLVINATGYTKVDQAETDREASFALNATAVENLTQLLSKTNTPLLHFSTDYVFDGTKKTPYLETDPPNPISVYGESKLAGEQLVKKYLKKFYIVRTAWPFGPGKNNFVQTIIEKGRDQGFLKVVNDQIGSPTATFDLAEAVSTLIQGSTYGIYHIVNSGQASWYDLAKEAIDLLGLPILVEPVGTSCIARPAKRPPYSVLGTIRFPQLRPWKDALGAYLQEKPLIL